MAVNLTANADKSQERFYDVLRELFVMFKLSKEWSYNVVARCDHLSAPRRTSEGPPRTRPRQHLTRSVLPLSVVT